MWGRPTQQQAGVLCCTMGGIPLSQLTSHNFLPTVSLHRTVLPGTAGSFRFAGTFGADDVYCMEEVDASSTDSASEGVGEGEAATSASAGESLRGRGITFLPDGLRTRGCLPPPPSRSNEESDIYISYPLGQRGNRQSDKRDDRPPCTR